MVDADIKTVIQHFAFTFPFCTKFVVHLLNKFLYMQPKTPVTPVAHENTGSKTLFVGNLSFQVERADVYVHLRASCKSRSIFA